MQSAESYTIGVVLWVALLKAHEVGWQIRKAPKLPPAPVDVVAAMVDESFTTDDSAAATAAASATASACPSPSASPNGTLGGGNRTPRTATNPSGAKRNPTVKRRGAMSVLARCMPYPCHLHIPEVSHHTVQS